MSRELKFRAYLKQEKEMCEVFSFCDKFIKVVVGIGTAWKLPISDFEPIMQFTGVKDKKGVDIYEGDKIKYKNFKGYSIIVFENGAFGYYGISCFITLLETNAEHILVIGNVFQDSE